MTGTALSAVEQSLLTVHVGDERFALPASDVAEVIRLPAVTRVPLAPASLLGVANLRGAVMPVVSLHILLGRDSTASSHARVVVIDRGAPVGLLIDRVASLGSTTDDSALNGSGPAQRIDLDSLLAKDFGGLTHRVQHKQFVASQALWEHAAAAQDEIALVCFSVAGQDFALPLSSVHEVVSFPEDVAALPQTDAVMLGVTTLRRQLLPLVSLHGLLGLQAGGQATGRPRVVVARIGQGLVGFAVDSMREILQIPSHIIDPVPTILTRGGAEAQIQGICRLEAGQRLVSILSTEHLFRDRAVVAQISPQAEENDNMRVADGLSTAGEQFIVFQLGGEEYGLSIAAVDEIVRVPDTLTRLPRAPAFIDGVINLRGRIVPVIDQRRRFKVEGQGERRQERIIVVRIDHMHAGFVVDSVSEVLKIPQSQLRPTPDLADDGSQSIDRIANLEVEGRMILLLNPRELLNRAEKDLLSAMSDDGAERPAS